MYFDGSLKLGGGGARVLFITEQLKYVLQILFEVSNNEPEYEALLHGLLWQNQPKLHWLKYASPLSRAPIVLQMV
jgi:hypothetical protein